MNPFSGYSYSIAGAGIAMFGVLLCLLFIVIIIKKSDAELRVLRARSAERHKIVPPEPVFPNVTSVASNMVNPREINYTPFTGRPNYGVQGSTIFQQPSGAAPTPFSEKANYTDPPVNGYISDMVGEPTQYTGIPASNPSDYPNQGRSLFEKPDLPPQRYTTGLERTEGEIYSDFGKPKISDVIQSSDAVPSIAREFEEKTTTHRITDTEDTK